MPAIHPHIPATALDFISKLRQNNNREWFNDHKDEYLNELDALENFANGLLAELNTHDVIETPSGKKALQRIYRDTRFAIDKTPYKSYWGGGFTRATAQRRGGYYFHIEPGNTFIAGGFWSPNAEDLKRVRNDINYDATPLREILADENFTSTFGTLQGEQLKKMPKGFSAHHEAIDLLRYKQFLLRKYFTDVEVLSPDFITKANQTYKNMRPFFDYMSEVLSTDSNGGAL
jgi:uncharacterized protein (TIGR02453 family)